MTPTTLDIHQAAEMMKVHPKTVLDLINSGVLPAAKVGRAYVLLTKDVMDHIENEIARQTAERMGASFRRKSPKRVGQRAASQIGVTHHHPVALVA